VDRSFALWAVPSGIGSYYLFKKYKTPYDIWCLGSDIWNHKDNPFTRPFLIKILKNAQNVYADGFNFSKTIEALSGRSCKFLPSSRNLPPLPQNTIPKQTNKKTFVFLGRYHLVKGPDLLIEAIRLLPKEVYDNSEFLFYGPGKLKTQLQNTINRLNFKNVILNDMVDNDHISEVITKAHFIVIPSRFDSIPVVLSDSLQFDTPVIGADIGDLGDIIKRFKLGYIFEKENTSELAYAISKAFYDKKEDYQTHIREAKKIFSVDNAVGEFIKNSS
jgi:glycosyltransferase involved in cell wall biosynthesis